MRQTTLLILIILLTVTAFSQTIKRQAGETAKMFANPVKPDSTELTHSVVETNALDTAKKLVVAFYRKTIYEAAQMKTYVDHNQYDILIGCLFIPMGNNKYERELIDTIDSDGGDPEILSIFFANADKDKSKELIVLCKYVQRHYDYEGAFYETFIYKYNKGKVIYLKQVSEKFFGCECGWRSGKTEKAKYKTVKEIRAGLLRMGFKQ